ncbi:MAG TPA: permease-like cell division protein FtsX [Egibacteraceae bacterium]|nr:permease-like cell division protein FtsX [Actinomycetota bacterium]HWB72473.1 permease-like cell division protein FtsX [Egibacteraceae bacterium]
MGPRWRYLTNEVVLGLRRNLLMTLATIVTVTVSLALLGAGLLVQRQVNLTRDLFYAQVEVSIFLQDEISESQRASLEQDLRENPQVQDVLYESKEDAYTHFQEIFKNDPNLTASVTPEILPASFRVKLVDPQQFAIVQSQYAGYPGVDEVSDQREVLDKFFRVMDAFRNGALAVALLQLFAAAALISNTIRITAFARREQTGIMKLVGATNWYIRLPFILEGIVAGVAGALCAGGLLLLAEATLISKLQRQILFIPFIGSGDVFAVLPVLVLIGAGIASAASFVSLRRFLAV